MFKIDVNMEQRHKDIKHYGGEDTDIIDWPKHILCHILQAQC